MLSPKPTNKKPLLSWKDLDKLLQSNFELSKKNTEPSATVDLDKYDLTFEEVKKEAESKGYKLEKLQNSFIRFT